MRLVCPSSEKKYTMTYMNEGHTCTLTGLAIVDLFTLGFAMLLLSKGKEKISERQLKMP